MCEPLEIEDYVPQPVVYVSPAKWHLAHTTWFFEEFVLKPFDKSYKLFQESFCFLFNSYYNAVGTRVSRHQRGDLTRPTVQEIYAYRQHVDDAMHRFMSHGELGQHILNLIELGLNHEHQHQELLITDIKYVLGQNPLFPVYKKGYNLTNQNNFCEGFLKVKEGLVDIGYDGDNFCYDNELGQHTVYLQEFEISKALVTNAEYLEFIEAGGYLKSEFWLDDGWTWVQSSEVHSPMYWHNKNGSWYHYCLSGLEPLAPHEILAHISFYEANAFATWKGYRLPTEFEWEAASERLEWGQRWEWTSSAYLPYPGFIIQDGAVGEYNGKFMVNQMVLRGASSATSPGHQRKTYRNFFHPQYQWQYSGIRLAK